MIDFNFNVEFSEFQQTIMLKKKTYTSVDFVKTEELECLEIRAVVLPYNDDLKNEKLDWSKKHIKVYTTIELENTFVVEYKKRDYKVVKVMDYEDYSHFLAICEEVK